MTVFYCCLLSPQLLLDAWWRPWRHRIRWREPWPTCLLATNGTSFRIRLQVSLRQEQKFLLVLPGITASFPPSSLYIYWTCEQIIQTASALTVASTLTKFSHPGHAGSMILRNIGVSILHGVRSQKTVGTEATPCVYTWKIMSGKFCTNLEFTNVPYNLQKRWNPSWWWRQFVRCCLYKVTMWTHRQFPPIWLSACLIRHDTERISN